MQFLTWRGIKKSIYEQCVIFPKINNNLFYIISGFFGNHFCKFGERRLDNKRKKEIWGKKETGEDYLNFHILQTMLLNSSVDMRYLQLLTH